MPDGRSLVWVLHPRSGSGPSRPLAMTFMRQSRLLVGVCAAFFAVACGDGPTPTSPTVVVAPGSDPGSVGGGATIGYIEDIKPILDADCVSCHGPRRREEGVDLSTLANVSRTFQPGSENSLLIRVSRSGGSMYREWRGSGSAKAELVRRWIVEFQARESR